MHRKDVSSRHGLCRQHHTDRAAPVRSQAVQEYALSKANTQATGTRIWSPARASSGTLGKVGQMSRLSGAREAGPASASSGMSLCSAHCLSRLVQSRVSPRGRVTRDMRTSGCGMPRLLILTIRTILSRNRATSRIIACARPGVDAVSCDLAESSRSMLSTISDMISSAPLCNSRLRPATVTC